MNNNDRIPTPLECIEEWNRKQALLDEIGALKQEHEYLTSTVETLWETEHTLRQSIIRLSHTLSQLYELTGKMVEARTTKAGYSIKNSIVQNGG